MNTASIFVTMYWRNVELTRDFRILMVCGRVQENAAARNDDSPAGWWTAASWAYTPNDGAGRIARAACTAMAESLRTAVPS